VLSARANNDGLGLPGCCGRRAQETVRRDSTASPHGLPNWVRIRRRRRPVRCMLPPTGLNCSAAVALALQPRSRSWRPIPRETKSH